MGSMKFTSRAGPPTKPIRVLGIPRRSAIPGGGSVVVFDRAASNPFVIIVRLIVRMTIGPDPDGVSAGAGDAAMGGALNSRTPEFAACRDRRSEGVTTTNKNIRAAKVAARPFVRRSAFLAFTRDNA